MADTSSPAVTDPQVLDANQQRYADFLVQYDASLPANLPDEQRFKYWEEALDAVVERDITVLADQLKEALEQTYNEALVESEHATVSQDIAAARQVLN